MKKRIERLRGMYDLLPDTYHHQHCIMDRLSTFLARVGYERVDTPMLEQRDLFLLSFEQELWQNLYTFRLHHRDLCLRPEYTASICRLYLDHYQRHPLPIRFQYAGPVFRYEAPGRERYRQHLLKFPNVPILLVEFYGSVDGAREFVRPVADYVGLFIQFCIGALTDRFFDNPVIVDYTGRFTGDWATFMPVMTAEYDRLGFPNLLGFHPDFSFSREDVERLRLLGVLEMGDEFLKEAGMNEREARIEIACRLFDAGKLTLPLSARFAGLDRGEMEDELLDRKIPLYRPTLNDYEEDVAVFRKLV